MRVSWSPITTVIDGLPERFVPDRFSAFVVGGGWLLDVEQRDGCICIVDTVPALAHMRWWNYGTVHGITEAIREEVAKLGR